MISVSQASVVFISTDGVCQWLASLYASINKSWEKIVLSRASQAEIMALEFFLCTHEVTAFVVFSIYFMFMCHSQNLALQYPGFSSMSLILILHKVVSGVKSSLFAASLPMCKICPPRHTWTAEISHKFPSPALPGKSHCVREAQLMCSCISKAGMFVFPAVPWLQRGIYPTFQELSPFQEILIYSHVLPLPPSATLGDCTLHPSVPPFPVYKRTRSSQFFCLLFGFGDVCSRNCL